ncbi:MAG: hypothetical protein QF926_13195 [Alphaproteobacteria bacterium]|jgi:hypothetical protein|nr:hypothetical protein [Alphaproteobacteria bacterium]MDP6517559.1 hypothetical protein [Alphaproteobacteria bacterium]
MKTPQALLIGLALVAAAIWLRSGPAPAQAGPEAPGFLPGFLLVADTQIARAWRLNTATGAISACVMRGDAAVCSPWTE